MVKKISNTENNSNSIIKILKVIGIILVIIIILLIIMFVNGFYPNKTDDLGETSIRCKLNDKEYSYNIWHDPEINEIKKAGGDSYFSDNINSEKYNYSIDLTNTIKKYANKNNASCKIYD